MTYLSTGDTSPDTSPRADGSRERFASSSRPLLLSVKEAADLIGLGRSTIYKLMDSGTLAFVHVGKSRRIPLDEAHAFVARLCRRSDGGNRGRMSE